MTPDPVVTLEPRRVKCPDCTTPDPIRTCWTCEGEETIPLPPYGMADDEWRIWLGTVQQDTDNYPSMEVDVADLREHYERLAATRAMLRSLIAHCECETGVPAEEWKAMHAEAGRAQFEEVRS